MPKTRDYMKKELRFFFFSIILFHLLPYEVNAGSAKCTYSDDNVTIKFSIDDMNGLSFTFDSDDNKTADISEIPPKTFKNNGRYSCDNEIYYYVKNNIVRFTTVKTSNVLPLIDKEIINDDAPDNEYTDAGNSSEYYCSYKNVPGMYVDNGKGFVPADNTTFDVIIYFSPKKYMYSPNGDYKLVNTEFAEVDPGKGNYIKENGAFVEIDITDSDQRKIGNYIAKKTYEKVDSGTGDYTYINEATAWGHIVCKSNCEEISYFKKNQYIVNSSYAFISTNNKPVEYTTGSQYTIADNYLHEWNHCGHGIQIILSPSNKNGSTYDFEYDFFPRDGNDIMPPLFGIATYDRCWYNCPTSSKLDNLVIGTLDYAYSPDEIDYFPFEEEIIENTENFLNEEKVYNTYINEGGIEITIGMGKESYQLCKKTEDGCEIIEAFFDNKYGTMPENFSSYKTMYHSGTGNMYYFGDCQTINTGTEIKNANYGFDKKDISLSCEKGDHAGYVPGDNEELYLCEKDEVKQSFQIIGYLLFCLKIAIPLLLIGLGILDFSKALLSEDDKVTKETAVKFAKRIITGIMIFFIPTVLNFIFSLIEGVDETTSKFEGCTACLFNPTDETKCKFEKVGFNDDVD